MCSRSNTMHPSFGGLQFLLEAAGLAEEEALAEQPCPAPPRKKPTTQMPSRPRKSQHTFRWSDGAPPLPPHLHNLCLRLPLHGKVDDTERCNMEEARRRRVVEMVAGGGRKRRRRREEEVMEAARREAESHWKAGDACMRKGEYDTAERAYSEALKLWPEAQEARGGRVWARMKLRRTSEAWEDALQAVMTRPHIAENWATLADIQRCMDQLPAARYSILQALSLDPLHRDYNDALADLRTTVLASLPPQQVRKPSTLTHPGQPPANLSSTSTTTGPNGIITTTTTTTTKPRQGWQKGGTITTSTSTTSIDGSSLMLPNNPPPHPSTLAPKPISWALSPSPPLPNKDMHNRYPGSQQQQHTKASPALPLNKAAQSTTVVTFRSQDKQHNRPPLRPTAAGEGPLPQTLPMSMPMPMAPITIKPEDNKASVPLSLGDKATAANPKAQRSTTTTSITTTSITTTTTSSNAFLSSLRISKDEMRVLMGQALSHLPKAHPPSPNNPNNMNKSHEDSGIWQRRAFALHLSKESSPILDDLFSSSGPQAADICRNPQCCASPCARATPTLAKDGSVSLSMPEHPPSLAAIVTNSNTSMDIDQSNTHTTGAPRPVDFQVFPKCPSAMARWIVTGHCAKCLGLECNTNTNTAAPTPTPTPRLNTHSPTPIPITQG